MSISDNKTDRQISNMLQPPVDFKHVLELYGLNNVITDPTCFKSVTPTLIDVIITDSLRRVGNTVILGSVIFTILYVLEQNCSYQGSPIILSSIVVIRNLRNPNFFRMFPGYLFMLPKYLTT